MIKDKYGQLIYDVKEVFDILMHDNDQFNESDSMPGPFIINDKSVDVKALNKLIHRQSLLTVTECDLTRDEFDRKNQENWLMPEFYKQFDIAEFVLSECTTQAELQRCGEELLLFQDRDLFNLLRYLKYLVDTMEHNSIIWGVGRGSSVASYVLYKLKVHRINSMYYQLDVGEFLR